MSLREITYLILSSALLVLAVGIVDLLRNPPARRLRLRTAGPAEPPVPSPLPDEPAPEPLAVPDESPGQTAEPAGEEEPSLAATASPALAADARPSAHELLRGGRVEEGIALLREQIAVACEADPEHAARLISLERAVASATGIPRIPGDPDEARRASSAIFGVQVWLGLSAAEQGQRETALQVFRGAAELGPTDAARTLAACAVVKELWAEGGAEEALSFLEAHARTIREPQCLARTFALLAETHLRRSPRDYARAFAMYERVLRETPPDRAFRFEGASRYLAGGARTMALFADGVPDDLAADETAELGFYPQKVRYYREEIRSTLALANVSLGLVRAGLAPADPEAAETGAPEALAVRELRARLPEALATEPPAPRTLPGGYVGHPRGFRMEATEYGCVRGTFMYRDHKIARFSGLVEGGALVFLWSTNPNSLDSAFLGGNYTSRYGHGLLLPVPGGFEGYTVEDDRGFHPPGADECMAWRLGRER